MWMFFFNFITSCNQVSRPSEPNRLMFFFLKGSIKTIQNPDHNYWQYYYRFIYVIYIYDKIKLRYQFPMHVKHGGK